jgi:hypothetical protein
VYLAGPGGFPLGEAQSLIDAGFRATLTGPPSHADLVPHRRALVIAGEANPRVRAEGVGAAMIDRLVHHADVVALKGDPYRLKVRDLGCVPVPGAGRPLDGGWVCALFDPSGLLSSGC